MSTEAGLSRMSGELSTLNTRADDQLEQLVRLEGRQADSELAIGELTGNTKKERLESLVKEFVEDYLAKHMHTQAQPHTSNQSPGISEGRTTSRHSYCECHMMMCVQRSSPC